MVRAIDRKCARRTKTGTEKEERDRYRDSLTHRQV